MEMLEQMKIIEDHLEEGLSEIDRLKEMNRTAMNQIYHADRSDKID